MYDKFYSLSKSPFSLLPDPSFLFLSRQHVMALTLLKYSLMNRHAFTVITGEVGAGKTTLLNKLLDEINNNYTIGLINFTDQRVEQLLPWVLRAYGLPYSKKDPVKMYDDFVQFLLQEHKQGHTTVLVVDEAQNLAKKALEKLRMLSNVNTREILLQVILVGQPEFRDTLKDPSFRQLNQRISVFYRLDPLSQQETADYIHHRVEVAGGNRRIFGSESINLIWTESGGIPRTINTLCDLAMIYGFANKLEVITTQVIEEMLLDRRELAVQTDTSMQNTAQTPQTSNDSTPLHVVRDYPRP